LTYTVVTSKSVVVSWLMHFARLANTLLKDEDVIVFVKRVMNGVTKKIFNISKLRNCNYYEVSVYRRS